MKFPEHVLIVDDDPIQRAVLKQIFVTRGSLGVEEADDGLEAISIIESSGVLFDLIILDLVMPEYDGIRLISYLESQNIKAPLILVSSLPGKIVRMSHTLAEVSGLRTLGWLQKPIHLEDLIAMVGAQDWPARKVAKFQPDELTQTSHA